VPFRHYLGAAPNGMNGLLSNWPQGIFCRSGPRFSWPTRRLRIRPADLSGQCLGRRARVSGRGSGVAGKSGL